MGLQRNIWDAQLQTGTLETVHQETNRMQKMTQPKKVGFSNPDGAIAAIAAVRKQIGVIRCTGTSGLWQPEFMVCKMHLARTHGWYEISKNEWRFRCTVEWGECCSRI